MKGIEFVALKSPRRAALSKPQGSPQGVNVAADPDIFVLERRAGPDVLVGAGQRVHFVIMFPAGKFSSRRKNSWFQSPRTSLRLPASACALTGLALVSLSSVAGADRTSNPFNALEHGRDRVAVLVHRATNASLILSSVRPQRSVAIVAPVADP